MDRILPVAGSRGLTLIELLVTLVVISITVLLAAPPMQQLLHGNRLRTEANRLVTAINLARSEAIIRNLPVSLCPSAMAGTGRAVCSGDYAGGWIVFSNRNRDRVVDEKTDEVIRVFQPIPQGYTLSNRAGTRFLSELITYLPDGSSRRNRTLLFCSPLGRELKPWSIVMNVVGRARVSSGEGICPLALP